ncbi:MAG: hypothetical protein LKG15_10450 [Corynebacterium provencense]|uniref:hypothetical protein n=1 Tax=Corynebacterium provencense TaxID=1737425 RepID=UPI002989EF3A|nr:hypothetical protein [Corynebacterium provencense]
MISPSASAQNSYTGYFDSRQFDDLLGGDAVVGRILVCPEDGDAAPENSAGMRPVAVNDLGDCDRKLDGDRAVVVPDTVDIAMAVEGMTIDLGDSVRVGGISYALGERTLIDLISAAALGDDATAGIVEELGLPRFDPSALGRYTTYQEVKDDAALPHRWVTTRECGSDVSGSDGCSDGGSGQLVDANADRRSAALAVAGYLTGESYDSTQPVILPAPGYPGALTDRAGNGTDTGQHLLSEAMRDGTARLSVTTALGLPARMLRSIDVDRSIVPYSVLGVSDSGANDTDGIVVSWFGRPVDVDLLTVLGIRKTGVTEQGDGGHGSSSSPVDVSTMEQSTCLAVSSPTSAFGTGDCASILGSFAPGSAPHTSDVAHGSGWGAGVRPSLALGNSALERQFADKRSRDALVDRLVGAVRDRGSVFSSATTVSGRRVTGAFLPSDVVLEEPVTVEWRGNQVVLFPGTSATKIDGDVAPDPVAVAAVAQAADADRSPKLSIVSWSGSLGDPSIELDDLPVPGRTFTALTSDGDAAGDLVGLDGKWRDEVRSRPGSSTADLPAGRVPSAAGENRGRERTAPVDGPWASAGERPAHVDPESVEAALATAAVEPSEAVEVPVAVEPTETVEAPEAVEPTEALEPSEAVEVPAAVEPTETVEAPEAVEPTEALEPTETVLVPAAVEPTVTPVDREESAESVGEQATVDDGAGAAPVNDADTPAPEDPSDSVVAVGEEVAAAEPDDAALPLEEAVEVPPVVGEQGAGTAHEE